MTMIQHNFDMDNNNLILRDAQVSLGNIKLFEIFEFRHPIKNHRIPSGDWINTIMEPLGFGKVIVFDMFHGLVQ
jgi:hypothetical protein